MCMYTNYIWDAHDYCAILGLFWYLYIHSIQQHQQLHNNNNNNNNNIKIK